MIRARYRVAKIHSVRKQRERLSDNSADHCRQTRQVGGSEVASAERSSRRRGRGTTARYENSSALRGASQYSIPLRS